MGNTFNFRMENRFWLRLRTSPGPGRPCCHVVLCLEPHVAVAQRRQGCTEPNAGVRIEDTCQHCNDL